MWLQKKHSFVFVFLALSLVFLNAAPVSAQQPQGIQVLGVRVEGAITADPGLVIANSGLVVGREIMGEDIQQAIKRIWALKLFRNVEILIEREVADGAFFLIRVEEYPRLETVKVEGNKKLKRREIEDMLDLYKGQVLRPARITSSIEKLKDKYAEKGYLLAEIEYEVFDTEQDTMQKGLRIVIKEGKKVRIKEIEFYGNEAFTDKKLRGTFDKTKRKSLFRSGSYDPVEFEMDLDLLIAFYHNHGYRDAHVVSDSISYTDDLKRMILHITVEEGTQYKFGDISFEGNTLFSNDELMAQLAFKPGDIYSEEELNFTASERLGSLYYDKGYIYSQIEPILTPVGEDTVNVHFSVREGNQFKVRQIHIIGNDRTKEKVIRREMVLYPGETFDVSKLRRSVREITILNYFGNIIPDVQPVSDNEVDLYMEVEEKPTDQANLAAGYSELDGMIGSVGFTMPNLFGSGQSFSLDWNFGQVYRSFSISYTEPWVFDTPTLAGVSLYDIRRGGTYYGFDEHVIGASFRVGRRFRWPDDYFRGDWIYRIERDLYDNFTDSFKEYNIQSLQEGIPRFSSSLTTIISRDSRDNAEFPSRGSVHSYSIELAGSVLGGDDQFVKQIGSSEWYFPLVSRLVLYSSSKFGIIHPLTNNPGDIPYIDFFFMGGSGLSYGEPLRGYEDRAVGPRTTVGGYSVGGKTLFKQSLELRVPIIDNPTVFILSFVDAGNTWLTPAETNLSDLRRSAGVGVRLYMPFIGLIGLDYGYGFDYSAADGTRKGEWVPHFQFGRTF